MLWIARWVGLGMRCDYKINIPTLNHIGYSQFIIIIISIISYHSKFCLGYYIIIRYYEKG